jgi:hypothetical protein
MKVAERFTIGNLESHQGRSLMNDAQLVSLKATFHAFALKTATLGDGP